MMNQLDPDLEKVAERVRKLLRLAERKAGNEAEAAAAAAKAQDLLAAYNLTMSSVEEAGAASGKREDARVKGGARAHERDLWRAVAELNFCFYFAGRHRVVRTHGIKTLAGEVIREPTYQRSFFHRVVGRTVNVAGTKAMATYLIGAIERLLRERLGEDNTQYSSEWVLAYREGATERIVEKLRERRAHLISEEQRKKEQEEQRLREAGRRAGDTATALTVAGLTKSEEQANYDFLNGEGAWARREARNAEWEKRWAEERAERARAEAEADAAHAAWAAANPEEAAAEAKKEAAEERRRERNWARRSPRYRAPSAQERRQMSGGYYAGRDAGDSIGLDQQAEAREAKRLA